MGVRSFAVAFAASLPLFGCMDTYLPDFDGGVLNPDIRFLQVAEVMEGVKCAAVAFMDERERGLMARRIADKGNGAISAIETGLHQSAPYSPYALNYKPDSNPKKEQLRPQCQRDEHYGCPLNADGSIPESCPASKVGCVANKCDLGLTEAPGGPPAALGATVWDYTSKSKNLADGGFRKGLYYDDPQQRGCVGVPDYSRFALDDTASATIDLTLLATNSGYVGFTKIDAPKTPFFPFITQGSTATQAPFPMATITPSAKTTFEMSAVMPQSIHLNDQSSSPANYGGGRGFGEFPNIAQPGQVYAYRPPSTAVPDALLALDRIADSDKWRVLIQEETPDPRRDIKSLHDEITALSAGSGVSWQQFYVEGSDASCRDIYSEPLLRQQCIDARKTVSDYAQLIGPLKKRNDQPVCPVGTDTVSCLALIHRELGNISGEIAQLIKPATLDAATTKPYVDWRNKSVRPTFDSLTSKLGRKVIIDTDALISDYLNKIAALPKNGAATADGPIVQEINIHISNLKQIMNDVKRAVEAAKREPDVKGPLHTTANLAVMAAARTLNEDQQRGDLLALALRLSKDAGPTVRRIQDSYVADMNTLASYIKASVGSKKKPPKDQYQQFASKCNTRSWRFHVDDHTEIDFLALKRLLFNIVEEQDKRIYYGIPDVTLDTLTLTSQFQLTLEVSAGTTHLFRFFPLVVPPTMDIKKDHTHTLKVVMHGKKQKGDKAASVKLAKSCNDRVKQSSNSSGGLTALLSSTDNFCDTQQGQLLESILESVEKTATAGSGSGGGSSGP